MVRDVQVQHGLKQLVPSDGASATERNLDIVFVHGLGGDCLKTWTHPGAEIPWIADRAFLGNLYDSARIMTFGYNSNVFQNVTTNRVITHANDLIEGLWARRYNCNGRPLIFVAHSLGGLIVKRALILCQDEDRFKDIQEMTRSVIFMGTPHEGSDQAKNLKVAQKIVSLVHAGQDIKNVTKELQAYSETTMDINKSFMRKASRNLTLLCFCETVPTRLPYGERMIVHQASAELNGNGARNIGMPCNHQQLCKFSSPTDSRFQLIFWPQFQIVVNEALKYVAERRAEQLEEETMERLRKLDTPTTRPTGHEANPDTIQGLRESMS